MVIRPVEVIRRLNDSVYVGKGLRDGDTVIITPVSAAKEGMDITVRFVKPLDKDRER
jgi:multidrug efflux pump subunit AcrA (membrane-fusion protein)